LLFFIAVCHYGVSILFSLYCSISCFIHVCYWFFHCWTIVVSLLNDCFYILVFYCFFHCSTIVLFHCCVSLLCYNVVFNCCVLFSCFIGVFHWFSLLNDCCIIVVRLLFSILLFQCCTTVVFHCYVSLRCFNVVFHCCVSFSCFIRLFYFFFIV
jgi:hypothetical protein